jgi:hypothetical protein
MEWLQPSGLKGRNSSRSAGFAASEPQQEDTGFLPGSLSAPLFLALGEQYRFGRKLAPHLSV